MLPYYCWFPLTLFKPLNEVKLFFLIDSPSPRNEHKRNKAQIYDIYFSVFKARWNYKVHQLSRDFEVLLCPDWIRFAQSVWATSRQNLFSELKLTSAIFVSEANHLGYITNLGSTCILSGLRTIQTMFMLYIRLLCFFFFVFVFFVVVVFFVFFGLFCFCFFVFCSHAAIQERKKRKKKEKKERKSLMSDNKEALLPYGLTAEVFRSGRVFSLYFML